jgi:hypothetical protein
MIVGLKLVGGLLIMLQEGKKNMRAGFYVHANLQARRKICARSVSSHHLVITYPACVHIAGDRQKWYLYVIWLSEVCRYQS